MINLMIKKPSLNCQELYFLVLSSNEAPLYSIVEQGMVISKIDF